MILLLTLIVGILIGAVSVVTLIAVPPRSAMGDGRHRDETEGRWNVYRRTERNSDG